MSNLREEQKQATRRALSSAAIDLFTTVGFDETRVEDIAAAAEVSARTFFLHFASKEDAAFPDHAALVDALADTLRSADPDLDPMDTVRQFVGSGVRHVVESPMRAKRYPLINNIDELRHRDVLGDLDYERVFVDYLTRSWADGPFVRPGDATTHRFEAQWVATAALGIARAALTTWASDRDFDPVAATERALEHLAP